MSDDNGHLFLPLQPVSVETPQGGVYKGKRLSGKRVSLPLCSDICLPLVAERVMTLQRIRRTLIVAAARLGVTVGENTPSNLTDS